jgi:hypothetical protein
MTTPDDKKPTIHTHDTIPEMAAANVPPVIETPPVIEAGHAREAVLIALANVARALGDLEATAVAIARALDVRGGGAT